MLTLTAGAETLVNTTVNGDQGAAFNDAQAGGTVAVLAGGGYVIVWQITGATYMQRFDALGAKLGSEVRLSDVTTSASDPVVTALSDGSFAVSWRQSTQTGLSVAVQHFDATGGAIGGLVQANTQLGNLWTPSIAGLVSGGFVVTWELEFQDGSGLGVYAQRFDSSGAKVGAETLVNTTTLYNQAAPSVTALGSGGYVIAWFSTTNADSVAPANVFLQQYDSAGAAVGGQTQVNTASTAVFQHLTSTTTVSLAGLATGGFVAVWTGLNINADTGSYGVFGQRFDSAGAKVGAEFLVNTFVAGGQTNPSVAALANGGFVVTWQSPDQDATVGEAAGSTGIYSQRYDVFGAREGGETLVNSTTHNSQFASSSAGTADGGYVATWTSFGQDTLVSNGVYERLFSNTDFTSLTAGSDTVNGTAADTLVATTPTAFGAGDALTGGAGTDTLKLTSAGTLDLTAAATFTGFEVVLGTSGDDTFAVSQSRLTGLTGLFGGAGVDSVSFAGSNDHNAVTLDASLSTTVLFDIEILYGGGGIDDFLGDARANTFNGGGGQDSLISYAGDDVLNGDEGDDFLIPGAGDDVVNGGLGSDTAIIFPSNGVTVDLSIAGPQNTGEGLDTFISIENLQGSDFGDVLSGDINTNVFHAGNGDDHLVGRGGADFLWGEAGDDLIEGGDGTDFLIGGIGNDTLDGGADMDEADYLLSAGAVSVDLRIATAQNTGSAGLDTLISIENVLGSSFDDVLIGDGGRNELYGMSGSDQLYGLAGDDVLRGGGHGQGAPDYLFGGAGNDIYYVNSSLTSTLDLVFEGGANPDLMAGVGDVDTIVSEGSFFWDFYSVGEQLFILDSEGSMLVGGKDVADKVITGGAGTDLISTYGHNATVDAGGGTDAISFNLYGLDQSYRGSNTVLMGPGSGIDYVYDFLSGTDHIDLRPFNFGITGAQVLAQAVNVDNPGTANDYCYFYLTSAGGVQNFIVFIGLLSSQLQGADFIT